jgi:hypothetical protein
VEGGQVTARETFRIVRAEPDDEPVHFGRPRCVYAWWISEELMRETET